MTKLYKLTDENGKTRTGAVNELQWGTAITHSAAGAGTQLCSDGVIHAYEHPLIAVLLNPIHAVLNAPRLWEAEGEIVAREGQFKCGVKTLTTVREIPLPDITLEQRVCFAILCALEVYKEESFVRWAKAWLSGEDRSEAKAEAMVDLAVAAETLPANAARWAAEMARWGTRWLAVAAWAATTTAKVLRPEELNLICLIEQALSSL